MDIQKILVFNVKRYRKLLGLSQKDLAKRVGISAPYMNEIEKGHKFPSSETLNSLCKALLVEPYQLFLDESTEIIEIVDAINKQLRDRMIRELDDMRDIFKDNDPKK